MFSPEHSSLKGSYLTKFINMPSRGSYVVTSHGAFIGRPLGAVPRMPRRIAATRRTKTVFVSRVSHVDWKDVPSEGSGVGVELCFLETPQNSVQKVKRI
jgi:hypothetical protein